MSFSPGRLLQALQQLPATDHYRVALSGGLDSMVLLHGLAQLGDRLGATLSAIHIDHAIHPDSAAWGAWCVAQCQRFGIPMLQQRVDVEGQKRLGIEAAARQARYAAFESIVEPGDLLLTAHHLDDQAETLLLQLLRGAGVAGLAAMPPQRRLGSALLGRPLLGFSRDELARYAGSQRLEWLEDPSNSDETLERNFLRHQLLPQLRERHPSISATLARTAHHLGESLALLDQLAEEGIAECSDDDGRRLKLAPLAAMGDAHRHNLIRYWLRRGGYPPPATIHLQRIDRELFTEREDAVPLVGWHGCELRRYRGELYAMRPLSSPPDNTFAIDWDGQSPLVLPTGIGQLVCRRGVEGGIAPASLDTGRFTIRFRVGGERCRPARRGHHHTLKKLFQERGVPPWLRDRWPLLYCGDQLVAVPGLFVCEPFAASEGEEGARIEWRTPLR